MGYLGYFLVLHSWISLSLAGDVCREKSSINGKWICDCEQNITSITYDCFGDKNPTEIYIWSDDLPEDTATFTIQNCATLILKIKKSLHIGHRLTEFKFFNVVNVSELILSSDLGYLPYLPSNVVFKNVNFESLDLPLLLPVNSLGQLCFTSLEFKNVTLKVLRRADLPQINLGQLIFDEVKVGLAENYAFEITGDRSIVKMTNSTFKNVDGKLMDLEVSKFIFSGNVIEKSNNGQKMFSLKADEVIFSNNIINELTNEKIKITSNNIKITHNIFQNVDENVFKEIKPLEPNHFSLDFSNNVIYSLTPEPLTTKNRDDIRISLFANVTIFNISINCVCGNIFWFEYVASNERAMVRNYFTSKWARKANLNKCLNFANCYVSQVMNNYHELCENNYKCPEEQLDNILSLNGKIDDSFLVLILLSFAIFLAGMYLLSQLFLITWSVFYSMKKWLVN